MAKNDSRRRFLKQSAGALLAVQGSVVFPAETVRKTGIRHPAKSIIGGYGPWAASLLPEVPRLSFRREKWKKVAGWQRQAREKVGELLAAPPVTVLPEVKVERHYSYDGLAIEELSWQLPYGHPTRAVVLKPANATGPLPGILVLHDHGGNKYFGYRKNVRISDAQHPLLAAHQERYYEDNAWANEIAKRGYVVMVHDAFTFGSRRVLFQDMEGISGGPLNTSGLTGQNPEAPENIQAYNTWAGHHEHVMSKSLFSAGTTWPGVFLGEDQVALSLLGARNDVISDRLGCGGLSGGGLRTVYLAGVDDRIKCAACVGFMTTWADFVLHKSYTHTWMTYTPLLPAYLEFPEILGLRVPLPTLVQNNNQDALFTLPEMKKADTILEAVYRKAGAGDRYRCSYYDGPHKFDQAMQAEAFDWFDRWLKG